MAAVAQDLADAIVAELAALSEVDKGDPTLVHGAWATAIETYLTANLVATGTYVGVIPGPAPDPANGVYTWSVSAMTIDPSAMEAGAVGSFAGWTAALALGIATTTFVGANDAAAFVVTTTVPVLLASYSLAAMVQAGETDHAAAVLAVATEIVNAITATAPVPTPAVSAATSNTGGTGTVTFTSVA